MCLCGGKCLWIQSVPVEFRKQYQIPWCWGHRLLSAAQIWMLGTELLSSARTAASPLAAESALCSLPLLLSHIHSHLRLSDVGTIRKTFVLYQHWERTGPLVLDFRVSMCGQQEELLAHLPQWNTFHRR